MLSAAKKVLVGKPKADPQEEPSWHDGDCYEDALEAHLHPDAHDEGGLACSNLELLEAQRSAVVEVIKSLGKGLLSGNLDLLRVSLPVRMFEPRSYLQKLADPWVYPERLRAAALARDPVQRLQHVVAYFVAGFHHAFTRWAKPFNPILGETWQAALPDGSRIAMEQVSHHPPVAAFQLDGPDGLYSFYGHSQPSVSYKTNAVKTSARGRRVLQFADGGRIEVAFPTYYLRGLLYTAAPRAEVTGTAEFTDARNGLTTVVRFGRVEDGVGGAPRSPLLQRPDALSGAIYRALPVSPGGGGSASSSVGSVGSCHPAPPGRLQDKAKRGAAAGLSTRVKASLSLSALRAPRGAHGGGDEAGRLEVARCTGNWLSHLDWDGQRWWTLLEDEASAWVPVAAPLPSDCRHREDLAALAAGDVRGAQRAKELLEQLQRADAKLRKDAAAAGGTGSPTGSSQASHR